VLNNLNTHRLSNLLSDLLVLHRFTDGRTEPSHVYDQLLLSPDPLPYPSKSYLILTATFHQYIEVSCRTATGANADMGRMRGLEGSEKAIGAIGQRPHTQDGAIMQDLAVVGAQHVFEVFKERLDLPA
jgi:hypothetical protein